MFQYNGLYLLAVTKKNANVTVMILFLYKLIEVFKDYFGELEEESIRYDASLFIAIHWL